MPKTYEPIATTTLGSNQTSVTISSIPATYTDLVLIAQVQTLPSGGSLAVQLNSDTGTNYSYTRLYGNGTTATSDRTANTTAILSFGASTLNPVTYILQLQNYSNATTYKTAISRVSNSGEFVASIVGLWRNTAAVTTMTINAITTNFPAGSTFTLYGIKQFT